MADLQMKPLIYKEIADDWETNPMEWYHAMISIENLLIVIAIPEMNIYS